MSVFPAFNYYELPATIRRGLSGQRRGNGKRGVHKLRNGPSPIGNANGLRWRRAQGFAEPIAGCAIFREAGRQSLKEQPIMDKVLSLLISVGIIIFGAWVVTATIVKGWPLVWTLMALFPFLTGFISLYGSMKATED